MATGAGLTRDRLSGSRDQPTGEGMWNTAALRTAHQLKTSLEFKTYCFIYIFLNAVNHLLRKKPKALICFFSTVKLFKI